MKRLLAFILFLSFFNGPLLAQQNLEDSLNKVIAENKDEGEVARAYNTLAIEYRRKNPDKARTYLNTAIAIGKRTGNFSRLSASYSQLVYLLHDLGKTDSAEYYVNEVKNLYEQAGNAEKNEVGTSYYIVAALFYKRTGANKKAIPFLEKAIEMCILTKDKVSTAGQMLNLGNTYVQLADYQKATEQFLKSLDIFEELGNERGISFCYQGLSNCFMELKQYDKALIYTDKSLQLKTKLNDRKGMCTAHGSLGLIYQGMGQPDKAMAHYNTSLAIAKEVKSLPDEMRNYVNIANIYKDKKEAAQATEYFNQARQVAIQLKDSAYLASVTTALIALQNSSSNPADEENKLQASQAFLEESGDLNKQAASLKNIADFYVAKNKFDKALEYTNKYHKTVDSIASNDLIIQVQKMEKLYNLEKKENEINLLKKDQQLNQAKLQKQNFFQYGALLFSGLILLSAFLLFNRYTLRQKMKQLELRNQIAADLHDEVGSSLSSINMLSQMAIQPGNEAMQKSILETMSSNARETMEKMGDLVWTIKPEEAEGSNLRQRMERFAYEICGAKNIALSLQLDKLETKDLTMEQRKSIYLIFKEALNNAVKYSGTEKIAVSAANGSNLLTMIVKDEGKGFDMDTVLKGNGLENIQTRAASVGGKLLIDSAPGSGTTVKLTMPLTI